MDSNLASSSIHQSTDRVIVCVRSKTNSTSVFNTSFTFGEDNEKCMNNLVDDIRKKVLAPHRKTGIWLGRNADSSSEPGFTFPNHFDLLTNKDGKTILLNLRESDDNADVENSCDDTATPSKSFCNSPGGNT
nr:hypothetical protein [Tanacetum cinerariifolium]